MADVLKIEWRVGERKQVDFPIECTDSDGSRIVVARVPVTSKTDAEQVAKAIAALPKLLVALNNLKEAVEYTPLGVRGIKAVEQARNALFDATGAKS